MPRISSSLAYTEVFRPLQEFAALAPSEIDPGLVQLLQLRASQINGCSVCTDGHWRMARKAGESDERLFAVGAWRDTPYFTDAERAALALTEAVTRLADRPDPVPDEVWAAAAEHWDEKALLSLVIHIAVINTANRLNVATGQQAGAWKP